MPLTTGETILNGKYRIVEFLGKGAFARVYRARHERLQRDVAIKTLRRGEEGVGSTRLSAYRDRFQLEAELGAQFDDPHLVKVYDFEEEDGALYLVMEYCPGGSLQKRLEEGPLPIEDAVRMAREVAEGLALLHQHRPQIVHRDLKPSNILFGADGAAKVADLGLAQVPGQTSLHSELGSAADYHPGTPEYMSPEQEESKGYLQPPSDVWALGAVLFETLTGEMCKAVRPGTRVRELRSEVPEWLDELVARCLAKDREARPWEGAEVAEALGEDLAEAEGVRREVEEAARREAEEQSRWVRELVAKADRALREGDWTEARRLAGEIEGLEHRSREAERIERGAQRVKREEEARRQREAEERRQTQAGRVKAQRTVQLSGLLAVVVVVVLLGVGVLAVALWPRSMPTPTMIARERSDEKTPPTATAAAQEQPVPGPTRPIFHSTATRRPPTATRRPEPSAVVQVNTLNVREGPNTDYPIVNKTYEGQRLAIQGRDVGSTWLKVRLSDGTFGWIAVEYVRLNVGLDSIPVASAPPKPRCQVAVDSQLAEAWSSAKLGCPTDAPRTTWATWQPFERGYMFWRYDTKRIYVLREDGAYADYPDVWDQVSPIPSQGSPPAGRLAPVRGFGYLWSSNEGVRDRLGWAVEEERGFCARVQSYERGFLARSTTVETCLDDLYNEARYPDFAPLLLAIYQSSTWYLY